MKTALYVENGVTQIVLSPDTEEERDILRRFENSKVDRVYWGTFGKCEGGWYRFYEDDTSLIFLLEGKKKK